MLKSGLIVTGLGFVSNRQVQASRAMSQLMEHIEAMLDKDVADNMAIGRYGAEDILVRVPAHQSVKVTGIEYPLEPATQLSLSLLVELKP